MGGSVLEEKSTSAFEFQHFLLWQICRANYMKILPLHFLGNVFAEAGRILY